LRRAWPTSLGVAWDFGPWIIQSSSLPGTFILNFTGWWPVRSKTGPGTIPVEAAHHDGFDEQGP
jgi:hypothetical protein